MLAPEIYKESLGPLFSNAQIMQIDHADHLKIIGLLQWA